MSPEVKDHWTMEQHLAASRQAVREIEREQRPGPQPICHHFDAINPVDPMTVSVEDTYRHLCGRFSDMGLDLLPDRLEAWETSKADAFWVAERIPVMFDIASASGLIYRGWTWEPSDRQPIGTATFQVINNRGC